MCCNRAIRQGGTASCCSSFRTAACSVSSSGYSIAALRRLTLQRSRNVGDGLLMRDGYTLVWLGWEFDVPMPRLRLEPPPARLPAGTVIEPLSVDIVVNDRVDETVLVDEPVRPPVPYPPADPASTASTLTVRQQFWGEETVIPRDRWRFTATPAGLPMVRLDGGFEPGLWYRVSYEPANPVVAGVALAAIRDAAAAFRYRTDLPVRGDTAYAFGQSQTGRLLREFLYGGFNVDREGRRVFDAMWVHIAGAARGSFNRRFATPAHGDMYLATRAPFADVVETDADGTSDGLQSRYPEDIRPRIFYTNTPVEYWGGGRAAALTHTSVDGERDLPLPDNLRMYVLAGTQHLVAPFPPVRVDSVTPGDPSVAAAARSDGQQPSNPTPQANIMRGLLRAWHAWAADDVEPPSSRYPRLADGTLVTAEDVSFPALPGVSDPRRIEGPAQVISGQVVALPHLVPQVDVDGNDLAGVHDPEAAVPLATTTGWNFRAARVGNPDQLYQTLGSYIPFARTRSEREALGDPRRSIEERYVDREDFLRRVRDAANELVGMRLMLEEDVDDALARAAEHWSLATANDISSTLPGFPR